jgi:hypothetical protein
MVNKKFSHKFSLFVFGIIVYLFPIVAVFGQATKLKNIIEGELVYSNILYKDKDHVFGYVLVYSHENREDFSRDFEYIILNDNLEQAYRRTVKQRRINYYSVDIDKISLFGDSLLVEIKYCAVYCFTSFRFLSLKSDSASTIYARDKNGIEVLKYNKKSYKDYYKDYNYDRFTVVNTDHGHYFTDALLSGGYIADSISLFNPDLTIKWSYNFNATKIKNKIKTAELLYISNDRMYVTVYLRKKWQNTFDHTPGEKLSRSLVCLSLQTGNLIFEHIIEDNKEEAIHDINIFEQDSLITIVGNYCKPEFKYYINKENDLGYYHIVLDGRGNLVSKRLLDWAKMNPAGNLKANGKDKEGFQLRGIKLYKFKDGTYIILSEKYKPSSAGFSLPIPIVSEVVGMATARSERSKDFMLHYLDKEFAIIKSMTINKEISKGKEYDFLYSQYMEDHDGMFFLYKDEIITKNKKANDAGNWKLGIVKFKHGNMSEEFIPIASNLAHKVIGMPAKQGFILLAELDKDDKLLELRLEKIN